MFQRTFACLFVVFTFSHSFAESGKKYYISIAKGHLHGWNTSTPECRELTSSESRHHKKCEDASHEGHMCTTDKKVELTNLKTKKKKKYPVLHFIYSSRESCEKELISFLNPGE